MPKSPEVSVGDQLSDHPIVNLLSNNAKTAIKNSLKGLAAQASCAYRAIPCPRDLTIFPVPSIPETGDEVGDRGGTKVRQLRDLEVTFFETPPLDSGFVGITTPDVSPVMFEGREFQPIERPSDDIVILAAKDSADAIGRARTSLVSSPLPPVLPIPPGTETPEEAVEIARTPPKTPATTVPKGPTIPVPAGHCGGFFGPVSVGGDTAIAFLINGNLTIAAVNVGGKAFVSGKFFVEYLNASPTGGPCTAGACSSETSLVVSVRVGIDAKLYFQATAGLVVPGLPNLPRVGPGVSGFFGVDISTEAFADCVIPAA